MDSDVAALVRAERLRDAAALAFARGDWQCSADLLERGCYFAEAAEVCEKAGDAARALALWVLGARDADATRCFALLGGADHEPAVRRLAGDLGARGDHRWAARCHERVNSLSEAAQHYERADEPDRAAACLERSGDVVAAARLLEAWLRRRPDLHVLHIQLARLLLKFGKTEAAVRHLQAVTGALRAEALALLADAFASLGLSEAELAARAELAALGGFEHAPISRGSAAVAVRIFGRYILRHEVAETPTARVLECEDSVRQQPVALKIFASVAARGGGRDALARFEREVRVLSSLDHPNIVSLYDYIPEGPAIAMEWMAGGTLESLLQSTVLTPRRAVEIACVLLSALAEAHRLGVIHRDLKPANVLFDAAGTAKLGDFGVAHLGDLTATATAAVVGSRGYMSPEQRVGNPATVRSDVYGVGALLLEMLTGAPPDPLASSLQQPSAAHRDLDAVHDAAILALLSEDPLARPDGALAARTRLTALRWPDVLQPVARRAMAPAQVAAAQLRFQPGPEQTTWDELLRREVVCVEANAAHVRRAAFFAAANLPQFQRVYAISAADNLLILGAAPRTPAQPALTAAERAWLEQGVANLHARGCVHGALDDEHVGRSASGTPLIRLALAEPHNLTQAAEARAFAEL